MGTKTCRQHREQEATNCCKLRNTNARLAHRQSSSLSLSFSFSLAISFAVFRSSVSCFAHSSTLRKNACFRRDPAFPYRRTILSVLPLASDPIVRASCRRLAWRIEILIMNMKKIYLAKREQFKEHLNMIKNLCIILIV